jgi:hypothetical protein
MRYVSGNTATGAASGNGLTNNRPYGQGDAQSAIVESQNSTACNPAILGKSGYHSWYDYAVIRLSDVFESMANISLTQRLDCNLRIWINTGSVNVSVGGTLNNNTSQSYLLPSAQSTFTNTCPLMVNYVADGSATVATIPATTTGIVAGLFIAKPPTTSISGVNHASSNASHPLQNCRIYYSQITLKPEKHIEYINNNRAKKVVYTVLLLQL